MPQSYFNIMAKDTKRKTPVLGKYMFYHISIYGNGIEFILCEKIILTSLSKCGKINVFVDDCHCGNITKLKRKQITSIGYFGQNNNNNNNFHTITHQVQILIPILHYQTSNWFGSYHISC